MSKFDEVVATYKSDIEKLNIQVDIALVTAVAKKLGPSIYNNDSSKVSGTDKSEMDRVKVNFLIGKLGLKDSPELDAAVVEACNAMGSSNKNKYRAIIYALLVKKFGKQSLYA